MKRGNIDPEARAKSERAAGDDAAEEFSDLLSPIRRGRQHPELPAHIRRLMQPSGPWQSQLHGGRFGNVCALR
jgi:hypothetical protein